MTMPPPGRRDQLVFLPIGGVGEIGMNLALYGYGPERDRTWLVVDFGIAFAGPDLPGADVILPDVSYLEEERRNIVGILITHAHEDHFGALLDLWPRLRVPVYATAFTKGLFEAKRASDPGGDVPITLVKPGEPFDLGPFNVEYINVAHSIPESNALAIRTPLGTVIHTGDWKLDDTPVLGLPTDSARLKAIGDEGVLALVCDSTNAMREGRSPSETEVAASLATIVGEAKQRIAFTTFASNVGRLRSVALAAAAARREVVVVGRAMRRAIDVAAELGYLDGLPPFLDQDAFAHLPRHRVVLLLTGSQGEPRAALARIVEEDHKAIDLDPGDTVVFSSRTIPGNEVPVNRLINGLVRRGVKVITDHDGRLVHVSGHPRRGELREMYGWVRPQIAVPVHGEPQHLAAHAELARSLAVPEVRVIADGAMLRLAPGRAEVVDNIEPERLYRDGTLIGGLEAMGIVERRRLAFAGHVGVSVILSAKGELEADPEIMASGIPIRDGAGRPLEEAIHAAILGTLESLPRARRRDPEVVREAIRRAVRGSVAESWGKKPVCSVFVAVL